MSSLGKGRGWTTGLCPGRSEGRHREEGDVAWNPRGFGLRHPHSQKYPENWTLASSVVNSLLIDLRTVRIRVDKTCKREHSKKDRGRG